MNHQVKLKRNNRIADYFVIVTAPDTLTPVDETDDESFKLTRSNFMSARYESTMVDRYPLVDRKDSKLPQGIEYFCLPNGLYLLPENSKPLFHSFVHTSDDGSRKLGCCLTIYEKLTKSQQDSLFAQIATEDEIKVDQEEELLISLSGKLSVIAEADIEEEEKSDKMSRVADVSVRSFQDRTLREEINSLYMTKCLCLISSWPFVTSFKKFLVGLYNISRMKSMHSSNPSSRNNSTSTPIDSVLFRSPSPTADTGSPPPAAPPSAQVTGSPSTSSSNSSMREYLNIGKSGKAEIPLERWICNFLDDVPAPPAGKVDIIYYLADQVLSFRCPPANEPNVWSGLPLFALFECLSPENICALFALVLTERQVLFVSSQYSLLTACAEAITSLIYPLTWSHAYIPILPYQLLGVLGAPFPFILGLHSSTYSDQRACTISEETVRVLLDENRILYGSQGPPPPLPERRYKKLLSHIKETAPVFENRASRWHSHHKPMTSSHTGSNNHNNNNNNNIINNNGATTTIGITSEKNTPVASTSFGGFLASPSRVTNFEHCSDDWHLTRMPYFDDAYSSVSEKETFLGMAGNTQFNESVVREGFLKFFVAIMKNYKKYLIYGNSENPDPIVKFKFQEFVSEHPTDWQPFIRSMIDSQAFSQFIDERVLFFKQDQDVLYFDESIDAKMNRYTFKFKNIDTPFLLDSTNKHIKTYVSPSPDTAGLLSLTNQQETRHRKGSDYEDDIERFPKLNHHMYSKPRHIEVKFDGNLSGYAVFNQIRLKRKNNYVAPPNNVVPAHAAVYSCYLVIISQMICLEMQKIAQKLTAAKGGTAPSTQYIIEEYNHATKDIVTVGSRDRQDSHDRPHSGPSVGLSSNGDAKNGGTPDKTEIHSSVRGRSASIRALSNAMLPTPSKYDMAKYHDDYQATAKACKLALRVAFEALNCLSRLDYAPQESVFRSLADACGACGDSDAIIDLLVYMDDQGLLPDHQMLHAVVRALAANPVSVTAECLVSAASVKPPEDTQPHSTTTRLYQMFIGSGTTTNNNANTSNALPTNTYAEITIAGKDRRSDSVVSNPGTKLRNKVIAPVEVWTFFEWRSLQRAPSSLVSRKTVISPPDSTGTVSKLLFGTATSSGSAAGDGISQLKPSVTSSSGSMHSSISSTSGGAGVVGSGGGGHVTSPSGGVTAAVGSGVVAVGSSILAVPGVALHTVASVLSPSAATSNHLLNNNNNNNSATSSAPVGYSDMSFRWSSNLTTDGSVPRLQWSNLSNPHRNPVFYASKKLHRHMRICEKRLIETFPDLCIELESPFGTLCPNKKCPIRRPLTIGEIHQGWNSGDNAGDANKYTTRCIHCGQEFIPRIQITSKLPNGYTHTTGDDSVSPPFGPTPSSEDSSSINNSSRKSVDTYEFWCELLSPWVLGKELFNILYQDGITSVIDCNFLKPGNNVSIQRMIVFWNMLIAFRLRGLPYTFLLPNESIVQAFPLPPPPPATVQAPFKSNPAFTTPPPKCASRSVSDAKTDKFERNSLGSSSLDREGAAAFERDLLEFSTKERDLLIFSTKMSTLEGSVVGSSSSALGETEGNSEGDGSFIADDSMEQDLLVFSTKESNKDRDLLMFTPADHSESAEDEGGGEVSHDV